MTSFIEVCGGGIPSSVKALPTVDTASGAIASFNTDLTENLVEVKCQIVAKQASGTPSPVSPLPITGFSQADISVCGKNLVNTANITDVVYNDLGQTRKGFIIRGGGTYTISVQRAYTNSTYIFVKALNADGTFGSVQYVIQGMATANKTLTIENGGALLVYSSETASLFETIVNYCSLQIEVGNAATAYEPYTGNLYTVDFGQTIYGGVLDITTGKLRVTHKNIIYNGGASESWYYSEQSSTGRRRVFLGADALTNVSPVESDVVSNMFVYSSDNNYYPDVDKMYINTTPSLLLGVDSSITSVSDWRTFLSNNNLQIVVKLTTPIIVQLSSTQITALLNENNIWCDTGDTEVKYLLTVGKKIS